MSRRTLIAGALLAGLVVGAGGPAGAQEPAAEAALAAKARYWQARQRDDLALQSWQRLIEANPNNAEALFNLGLINAAAGRETEAREFLLRLGTAAPGDPRIAQVEAAIRRGRLDPAGLDNARRLARAGRMADAVAAYEALFGERGPPDDLAVEYYQTMAGVPHRWDDAQAGLRQLADRTGSAAARLALAQVLTYRDQSRQQGIDLLARLSDDPAVGTLARAAWRDALGWLPTGVESIPQYQAYLDRNGTDPKIAALVAKAHQPRQLTPEEQAGADRQQAFDQLNKGRLEQAIRDFEAVLAKRPDDPDALGGLGVARLQQNRPAEAKRLIEQAIAAAPDSRSKWEPALAGAEFGLLIQDGKAAQAADRYSDAIARFRQAESRAPAGDTTAQLLIAQTEALAGRTAEAERAFRTVLARKPNDSAAATGLLGVLTQAKRYDEAAALAAKLGPSSPASQDFRKQAQLRDLKAQADAAGEQGDWATAVRAMAEARELAPTDPWVAIDYARALRHQDSPEIADQVMDRIATRADVDAAAAEAAAIYDSEAGRLDAALAAIDRVPAAKRSAALDALRRQLTVRREIVQAKQAPAPDQARAALLAIAGRVPSDPEAVTQVAMALKDVGASDAANQLMRGLLQRVPNAPPGAWLGYGALLLDAGREADLRAVLAKVDGAGTLSAIDRQSLDGLRAGLAVRAADRARAQGELATAYDQLAPALHAQPHSPALLSALARLYESARQPRQASAIYDSVLARDPGNIDALRGAIGAGVVANDTAHARQLVDAALSRAPEDPQLMLLKAELERASGNVAEAVRLLRQARSLVGGAPLDFAGAAAPTVLPGPAAAPAQPQHVPGNPFVTGTSLPIGLRRALPVVSEADLKRPVREVAALGPVDDPGPVRTAQAAPLGLQPYLGPGEPNPAFAPPLSVQPPPTPQNRALQSDIDKTLAEIDKATATTAQGGIAVTSRSGEAGLGRGSRIETPLQVALSPNYTGRLTASLTPTFIDSGNLDIGTFTTARQFGTNAALGAGAAVAPTGQASGAGINVAYTLKGVSADIGTTPLGFPVTNAVGGVAYETKLGAAPVTVRGEVSRRAVTETLQSYAGTKTAAVPALGLAAQTSGGVVNTAGRVDVSYDDSLFGAYANGKYGILTGRNVQQNHGIEAGTGAYIRPYRSDTDELKVGLNLTSLFYDRNLRYFTLGQGGYYSPQSYYSASIPVEYSGKAGAFEYDLKASAGLIQVREKSSPYFPTNARAQAALDAVAALDPTQPSRYPGQSRSSLGYTIGGKVEYEFLPNLRVGAEVSSDNAYNYDETRAALYLKRTFSTLAQ